MLIAIASLIWVPIGVWIGLRPGWHAQCSRWRSSWPPSRPTCCSRSRFVIVRLHVNPDIWLSPLMILGTQWYILFNVIAGASGLAHATCSEAAANFHVRGWLWWREVALPGIFPYLRHRRAHRLRRLLERHDRRRGGELGPRPSSRAAGLGAYIARRHRPRATIPRVVLGIAVMSLSS